MRERDRQRKLCVKILKGESETLVLCSSENVDVCVCVLVVCGACVCVISGRLKMYIAFRTSFIIIKNVFPPRLSCCSFFSFTVIPSSPTVLLVFRLNIEDKKEKKMKYFSLVIWKTFRVCSTLCYFHRFLMFRNFVGIWKREKFWHTELL